MNIKFNINNNKTFVKIDDGKIIFKVVKQDGSSFIYGIDDITTTDPMDLTKEGITAKEMESWRMGKNPEVTKAKSKLEKIKNIIE